MQPPCAPRARRPGASRGHQPLPLPPSFLSSRQPDAFYSHGNERDRSKDDGKGGLLAKEIKAT